ncbi:MAG: hypothetical protein DRP89_08100 [Candidatus Neomarinimicrobiota bacterium]|nr:MAG: hypothetical protein DRP89_08100 [Candidatus Neomarinimicrobiota bacterium]
MYKDDDFQPLLKDNVSEVKAQFSRKHTVIKGQLIRLKPAVKIEIDEKDFGGNEGESVQPIISNGEITGVVHRCSCGKVAKILFEYVGTQKSP